MQGAWRCKLLARSCTKDSLPRTCLACRVGLTMLVMQASARLTGLSVGPEPRGLESPWCYKKRS